MAYGRLGVLIPPSATLSVVYTVNGNCMYCDDLTISVTNPNAAIATISIAIATSITPNANEYIAKAVPLTAAGGLLEIARQIVSPGELIVIRSDKADTIFRVSGKELNNLR